MATAPITIRILFIVRSWADLKVGPYDCLLKVGPYDCPPDPGSRIPACIRIRPSA